MTKQPFKKGVDLSKWNTIKDWDKFSKNIHFAILKAGFDENGELGIAEGFEEKYNKCKEHHIPVGAYFYAPRIFDSATAENDAEFFIRECLQGKKFEYPIYLDVEDTSPRYKMTTTHAVNRFCKILQDNGAYVGIYSSSGYGFTDLLDLESLKEYDKWVAAWSDTPPALKGYPFGMWQYSSKGIVDGVEGNVDVDYAYYDFPVIMETKKLNDWTGSIQNTCHCHFLQDCACCQTSCKKKG